MGKTEHGNDDRIWAHAIVEMAPDAIIGVDGRQLIVSGNPAAAEIFGYAQGELVGQSVDILIPDDIRAQHAAMFERFMASDLRVLAGGKRMPVRAQRKSGDVFQAEATLSKVPLPNGETGVTIMLRDVTEQVRANEALRRSEERFRDFADTASDWLWEMDENLRFIYLSDGVKLTVGGNVAAGGIIGKTRRELAGEDTDDEKWRKHLVLLDEHKPFREFDYTYVTHTGESVHVSISGKPVFDADGNFKGYRGAGRDVTDVVRYQKKIAVSEERLRMILESSPVPLVMSGGADGRVLFANSAWRAAIEVEPDDLEGLKIGTLFADAGDQAALDRILSESRHVQGHLVRFRRLRSGDVFFASLNVTRMDFNGEEVLITGILDITERIVAEQALRKSESELRRHRDRLEELVHDRTLELENKNSQLEIALESEKRYSALQQEFVSLVSHEFRTPLTIIDSSAQRLLRQKAELDAETLKDRVGKIRSAVSRMTILIEKTLYASRLDAGNVTMEPEWFDLTSMARRVVDRQQEVCEQHHIRMAVAPGAGEIFGDPGLLEQVLVNLLSNAVKYSPQADHVDVSLGICSATDDSNPLKTDAYVMRVRDFGCGIPDDEQPQMFQRFFRASTSKGIPGTGIGLNVVRTLVSLHRGEIGFSSKPEEGTEFVVHIPRDFSVFH
ncbi:MAG: PAS domain S-box protein [Alphaproteobacteria bacterium]|nr:PAS domain S-box protein [Alphaproteobacteria bacterium]